MKPICIHCERFMRPKKNGVYFVEGMPTLPRSEGGVGKGATGWKPYKVWCGDLWICPSCEYQTIVGVGSAPVAEQHAPGFDSWLAAATLIPMIKDC